MSGSARITSIEAVGEFRAALGEFEDNVRGALAAAEIDVRRTLDWLRHQQQPFWKSEIRKREEKLTQAKSALSRAQSLTSELSPKSFVDEKKALDRVKRSVERAREKLARTKVWHREMERAFDTYKASVNRLERQITATLPAARARLAHTQERLDEYVSELPSGEREGDADRTASRLVAGVSDGGGSMARATPAAGHADTGTPRWSDLTPLRVERRRVPIDTARALPTSDDEQVLDRRSLARLETGVEALDKAASPVVAHDRIVVAPAWWNTRTLLCARLERPAIGDTGWYLGDADRETAPTTTDLVAARAGELIRAAPWIRTLLSMPRGSVALVCQGRVVALCDDRGTPLAIAGIVVGPSAEKLT